MKRKRLGFGRLWAALFWLALWQAASMVLAQPLLLPSPASVLLRLAVLVCGAAFWKAAAWSAVRILGGFLAGCLLGIALAVPAARRPWLRTLLEPPVSATKTVPVASFIILALVWFSSRTLPVLIAGLMVFPGVYLSVLSGIDSADPKLVELARVFRVPALRRLTGIYLPAVLPHFRAAAALGLGLCWKAGVAAEVIGLPTGSLGERLYTAKVYFETVDLFAWTAAIVALSALFEKLVLWALSALERRCGGAV